MPRQSSVAIPDATDGLTPLDEIPQDVKDYVEATYEKQRKTPARERAVYDTHKELEDEWNLILAYAKQRPAGILKARRSPTRASTLPKGLKADTTMDWRVVADVEANGARNAGNDRRQPVNQK